MRLGEIGIYVDAAGLIEHLDENPLWTVTREVQALKYLQLITLNVDRHEVYLLTTRLI
jgi:hypothetical protein